MNQSNSKADYPYMVTNLHVAVHPTVQAEYEVHRDARADGPQLYGVIARTSGWCAWDIESQEAAEKLALAHLRRTNPGDLAPVPRKPRTHKAIGQYWIDGQPSRGLGMNTDRKTAIGYSDTAKMDRVIVSFPPHLNNRKIPTLREMPAILRGDSIFNSQGWRDTVSAKVIARFKFYEMQERLDELYESGIKVAMPGFMDAWSAACYPTAEVTIIEDQAFYLLRDAMAVHGTYAEYKAAYRASVKRAWRKQYGEERCFPNRAMRAPYWPENAPRARSKVSGLVQVLKNYRMTPCNDGPQAVRAQIFADDRRAVYQFASLDASGRVVELFEFPQSWGIWVLRETIAAYDDKSRGRWSKE